MPTVTNTRHDCIALVATLLHLLVHPGYRPCVTRYVIMSVRCIKGEKTAVEHIAEPVPRSNPCRYMAPFREFRIVQGEGIERRAKFHTPFRSQTELDLQVRRQNCVVR